MRIIGQHVTGFTEFMRDRGVAGLAIGFVLGSAVQKMVASFVADIVNPLITLFTGSAENFANFKIGPFAIGDFLTTVIDFLLLAAVVYLVFKGFGLDKVEIKEIKNP